MKKIVAMITPFTLKQKVQAYEDGNKLEIVEPKMEDLTSTIFNLTNKYDIVDVTLIGPKQYNRGLKKTIETEEIRQYAENRLRINIME